MGHWTDVRRAVLVDGISKREACRRVGIHWQTLKRILEHSDPPGYQRTARVGQPVIGPWLGRLSELLEANGDLPRKQRYTVTRMWQVLQEEGFAPHFCRVRRANEKGVVEGSVKYSRQNFFVPVPQVADYAELNAHLRACCKSGSHPKVVVM